MSGLDKTDPNFKQDLLDSQESVELIAAWLENRGYTVTVPEIRIRPNDNRIQEYSDDGDLFVSGNKFSCQQRVEVKQRPDINFSSLANFPYRTIIVDTCHAWDEAERKPYAYFILNSTMTRAIIVEGDSSKYWKRVDKYDNKRKRKRSFYECPIDKCYIVDTSVVF